MSNDRATCWSVTINNPTAQDEEQIALARQKGWKVEGQKERGVEGTEHYQLMVRTPQVRFSAVKKQFPRAHIEQARNPSALSSYVRKEDTRVGDLAVQADKYPSLSKYWELVITQLDAWNYINMSYVFNPRFERDSQHFWWKEAPTRYRREPLEALDDVTTYLIEQGYHVETMACNPQVRMAWRKFHGAIAIRFYTDKDRQTDTRVQMTEEQVSTVNIPNANDNAWSSPPSGILEGSNRRKEEAGSSCGGSDEASDEDCDSGDC